ncbi:hypothetical protein SAMN06309944_1574 [Micrococcales bacterium KH10]|nr:hypothetical protein SAMN06309944_1574 [Micrococcales bacterium KH10]
MIDDERFRAVADDVARRLLGTGIQKSKHFEYIAHKQGVVIRLAYAPHTTEWAFLLSQEVQNDAPFEIADLLRVTECPVEIWSKFTPIITDNPVTGYQSLCERADALHTFGFRYLVGDPSAFAAARTDRSRRAKKYTEMINRAPVIAEAECAWRIGNMDEVVRLLSPYRGRLPLKEERRLTFAERKTSTNVKGLDI